MRVSTWHIFGKVGDGGELWGCCLNTCGFLSHPQSITNGLKKRSVPVTHEEREPKGLDNSHLNRSPW